MNKLWKINIVISWEIKYYLTAFNCNNTEFGANIGTKGISWVYIGQLIELKVATTRATLGV